MKRNSKTKVQNLDPDPNPDIRVHIRISAQVWPDFTQVDIPLDFKIWIYIQLFSDIWIQMHTPIDIESTIHRNQIKLN